MDEQSHTSSKIDLRFADYNIIFAISDCCLNKKFSFYNLSRQLAKKFISRLKHIEKMSWRRFAGLDRKYGLTVEGRNSPNFKMIDKQNSSPGKLVEKWYFHFRIEPNGLFRVFGYQKGQVFYITHIDPKGKINPHA